MFLTTSLTNLTFFTKFGSYEFQTKYHKSYFLIISQTSYNPTNMRILSKTGGQVVSTVLFDQLKCSLMGIITTMI